MKERTGKKLKRMKMPTNVCFRMVTRMDNEVFLRIGARTATTGRSSKNTCEVSRAGRAYSFSKLEKSVIYVVKMREMVLRLTGRRGLGRQRHFCRNKSRGHRLRVVILDSVLLSFAGLDECRCCRCHCRVSTLVTTHAAHYRFTFSHPTMHWTDLAANTTRG